MYTYVFVQHNRSLFNVENLQIVLMYLIAAKFSLYIACNNNNKIYIFKKIESVTNKLNHTVYCCNTLLVVI